ncbi:MAG: hypothetical protein Q4D23_11365 [Bacteroidales bacterium]|nr:hypothetical protein [Bacteroidales bacterium]
MKSAQEGIEAGVKTAQEGISNFSVDGVIQNVTDAAAAGAAMVGGAIESVIPKHEEETEENAVKDLISLLWCLAYVDGVISDEERAILGELSRSLDENYDSYVDELEQQCALALDVTAIEFGAENAPKLEAQRIIEGMHLSPNEAKLVCWNLLAIANSDSLDAAELDFIRFVSEKFGLESSVFEELRAYNDAVGETAFTRTALKSSDRSYAEIEPLMNELEHREQVILEAAQALIGDR